MKSYKHLILTALEQGLRVSVHDGEEWQVKRSRDYGRILSAVHSVELCNVRLRNAEGQHVGTFLVIPFGMADDETVADFTDNAWCNAWFDLYECQHETGARA